MRYSLRSRLELPSGSVVKDWPAMQEPQVDAGLIPGSGRFPWRRERQLIPVFLPGKCHGQRSLVGYSLWGHKELDMTEWLTFSLCGEELVSEGMLFSRVFFWNDCATPSPAGSYRQVSGAGGRGGEVHLSGAVSQVPNTSLAEFLLTHLCWTVCPLRHPSH